MNKYSDAALQRACRLLDDKLMADWQSQFIRPFPGESLNDCIVRSIEHLVIYRTIKDLLFEMAFNVPDLNEDELQDFEDDMQMVRDALSALLDSYPAIKTMDTRLREQARFDAQLAMADRTQARGTRHE